MNKILAFPDVDVEHGHWRPVISLADKLQAIDGRTVEVTFMGTLDCQKIVSDDYKDDYKTIFNEIYPLGYTARVKEKSAGQHSKLEHLNSIANGYLDSVIADMAPELILCGYFVSLEALLFHYKYNIPIAISTSYLRHPQETPQAMAFKYLANIPSKICAKLMNDAVRTGEDEEIADTYDGSLQSIRSFISPLENVWEIIPCPAVFDFPNYSHRGGTVYIEPSIIQSSPDGDSENRIIYATAGSRVNDYYDDAKRMFEMLIEMLNLPGMGNYELKIAAGKDMCRDLQKYSSMRVSLLQWADQAAILQTASVAVIHGGLASIKECIYYGVPTVVVPLGKDQMENALRVRKHRVGVYGLVDDMAAAKFRQLVTAAETDTFIKRDLPRMQTVFQDDENKTETDGVSKILDILDGNYWYDSDDVPEDTDGE